MTEACAQTWRGVPLPSQRAIRVYALNRPRKWTPPLGMCKRTRPELYEPCDCSNANITAIQCLKFDSWKKRRFGDDHHIDSAPERRSGGNTVTTSRLR